MLLAIVFFRQIPKSFNKMFCLTVLYFAMFNVLRDVVTTRDNHEAV